MSPGAGGRTETKAEGQEGSPVKKVKSGVWFRHGAFEVMAERQGVATCSCPKAVVELFRES